MRRKKKSPSQPSPLGCGGSKEGRRGEELGPEEITQRHSESWEEEKDGCNSKKKRRKKKRPGRIGRRILSFFTSTLPVALPPESELQGLVDLENGTLLCANWEYRIRIRRKCRRAMCELN